MSKQHQASALSKGKTNRCPFVSPSLLPTELRRTEAFLSASLFLAGSHPSLAALQITELGLSLEQALAIGVTEGHSLPPGAGKRLCFKADRWPSPGHQCTVTLHNNRGPHTVPPQSPY